MIENEDCLGGPPLPPKLYPSLSIRQKTVSAIPQTAANSNDKENMVRI